jgi:hypothetical protein
MRICKVDLVVCSRNIFVVFVLVCGALPAAANSRSIELEKAERQPNPNPVRVSSEGASLSWPGHLGTTREKAVTCLIVSQELEHEIQDRLKKGHEYTTACRITESLVVLLREFGGNGDPLVVLDLTRRDEPIELSRGLPWVERILKDKSNTPYIVVGGTSLGDLYYSIVSIYSTSTWEQTILARQVGVDNQNGFLECPEKGGYGYDTTKSIFEEKHRYEDQNGDGFEDIIIETVETSCSTHKSKTSTEVFLATDHGFKKAARFEAYSKLVNECWLLLVLDDFRLSGMFQLSESVLSHQYESPFHRIYILKTFRGEVFQLSSI